MYSKKQKAKGFYVYCWYGIVWVVKPILTLMATAIVIAIG
jgi:hypothetical protein